MQPAALSAPSLPVTTAGRQVRRRRSVTGWAQAARFRSSGEKVGPPHPCPDASPCGHGGRTAVRRREETRTELRMHSGTGREEHVGKETHFGNTHTFVPAFIFFKHRKKIILKPGQVYHPSTKSFYGAKPGGSAFKWPTVPANSTARGVPRPRGCCQEPNQSPEARGTSVPGGTVWTKSFVNGVCF